MHDAAQRKAVRDGRGVEVADTPVDPACVEQLVTPERLAPYRAACNGDLAAAVALYGWNARVSAALWETIGYVEIIVRNAMHRHLTDWSTRVHQEPAWYLDPGGNLTWRAAQDVADARRRATKFGTPETPGRVVAELGFGFWRYLTAVTYDRTLWRWCIYRAFPKKRRSVVQDSLASLHEARNRCAHYEPMHNRPIGKLYETALAVAGWINVDARRWVASQSRVVEHLANRPRGART